MAHQYLQRIQSYLKALNKTAIGLVAKEYLDIKTATQRNLSQEEAQIFKFFENIYVKTQYPKLINSSIDTIPEYDGFTLCEMEELFYKYTPRAKLEGAYDYIIVSKIHTASTSKMFLPCLEGRPKSSKFAY